MKNFTRHQKLTGSKSTERQAAGTRTAVLVIVALLAGVAGGALIVFQATRKPAQVIAPGSIQLSDGTKAVLARLDSPVQLHFHALYNPESVSDNVREAADRAAALLAEVARQSAGKIILTRATNWSVASANAAAAAGLVPFNIQKGDAIYLGLLLQQGNHRELMPQILPEWAPALEFDFARLLERFIVVESKPKLAADLARTSSAEQTVKQTFSDPSTVSLADGKKILQELSLKEFQSVAQEMNQAVANMEQRIRQAESANAESEKQALQLQLQELRAKFGDKLREVALRAQALQETWARLKQS